MRAIETPSSNGYVDLEGGTIANRLPLQRGDHAGPDGVVEAGDPCYHLPYVRTVWTLSPDERAQIATDRNIELVIAGTRVPPLLLNMTDEGPTGEPAQPPLDDARVWTALAEVLARDVVEVIGYLEGHAEREPLLADDLVERMDRLGGLREHLDRALAELSRMRAEQAQAEGEEPSA